MDYLDYLPHTAYADLPAAVQAQITAAEYGDLRRISHALASDAAPALPPALQTAFQQKIEVSEVGASPLSATAAGGSGRRQKPRWFWTAAAGWLLLAVAMSALLLREPKEKLVYQLVSAPVPDPIIQTDTIRETRTEFKTKYTTLRDTVYLPAAPELVYVMDTVYLSTPPEPPSQLVKSKAAAKERRLLKLLVETE